jgi:hypothetical protein
MINIARQNGTGIGYSFPIPGEKKGITGGNIVFIDDFYFPNEYCFREKIRDYRIKRFSYVYSYFGGGHDSR